MTDIEKLVTPDRWEMRFNGGSITVTSEPAAQLGLPGVTLFHWQFDLDTCSGDNYPSLRGALQAALDETWTALSDLAEEIEAKLDELEAKPEGGPL